jgi:hypothetical protein
MIWPSWVLLFWCGCAATCAAAVTGSLVGGSAPATWSLRIRAAPGVRSVAGTILAGVVVYPPIYGFIFEAARRADVTAGLALGLAHAILVALAARWAGRADGMPRLALMHVVYGAVLALLYVTP